MTGEKVSKDIWNFPDLVDTHVPLVFYNKKESVFMGHRSYDQDFKKEASRLVVEDGRTIRSVEDSLGITKGVLKDWVMQYRKDTENAFKGKDKAEHEQVRHLEKELARVTRERDILKKAVAIFSKEPNPYTGL